MSSIATMGTSVNTRLLSDGIQVAWPDATQAANAAARRMPGLGGVREPGADARAVFDQLAGTAVFVSILTPRYLKSDWCKKEIRSFCQRAEADNSLVLETETTGGSVTLDYYSAFY